MDNLDALLNELHQTNIELIKRNNVSLESPQPHIGQRIGEVTETEIDAVPVNSRTGRHAYHTSTPTAVDQFRPGARNTGDRTAMLDTLDADLDFGTFPVGRHMTKSSNLMRSTSSTKEEHADSTLETKLAAAKAAQQLDDLLVSLNHLKFENQPAKQSSRLSNPSSSSNGVTSTASPTSNDSGIGASRCDNHVQKPVVDPRLLSRLAQEQQPGGDGAASRQTRMPHPADNQPHSQQAVVTNLLTDLSNEVEQRGASTGTKGLCFACSRPITGMLVSALNKAWHPEHFNCANCSTSLVQVDHYEHEDQAYCGKCYPKLFSPKCAYCGESILEKCIVAMSRAWHPEHFFCYNCHTSFNGNVTVHEHENKVYCSVCYLNKFATRCYGCQQPITDTYITALDVPWHRQCFVCQDCGKVLTGYNFHEVEGSAYCDLHYHSRRGLLCAACTHPITGRCVNAMGQRYHPEHFVCAYCLKPPPTGTYKEHGGKPYCHQCFAQLFG